MRVIEIISSTQEARANCYRQPGNYVRSINYNRPAKQTSTSINSPLINLPVISIRQQKPQKQYKRTISSACNQQNQANQNLYPILIKIPINKNQTKIKTHNQA
jgi:hypothetical protein